MAHAYDYALIRVTRMPTGDGETVGVVLQSRRAGFLGVRFTRTSAAVAERWPGLDEALLRRAFGAFEAVARGGVSAAPIGLLPPSERFHWLTATRSTTLQTSPVRTGLSDDPATTLDHIARTLHTF